MTFSHTWRTRLFAIVGGCIAMVLGPMIAHEELLWPSIIVGGLTGIIIVWIQPRPLPGLLLATAIFGYIVGNRGFAQFSLLGRLPLLPGEVLLVAAGAIVMVQSAWRSETPWRRDALNITLILWFIAGTLRLAFDVRTHGIAAIRDYALVYYALYFLVAQAVAADAALARLLHRTLLVACGALLVMHPLFLQFPDFFLTTLTVRGVPLIYFKGDLVGNFLAMGTLLYFLEYERTRGRWWLVGSLALAALMISTGSRSSMVGVVVGAVWLAAAGRLRFTAFLCVGAVAAAFAFLIVAETRNQSWRDTPLHSIYERLASIGDPLGQRAYESAEAFKGDNNLFRIVWWRSAINEALDTNRWVGLGFGHDLAGRFVREYFPVGGEDFTARSPHNVLITVFARMGLVGLTLFIALITCMAVQTWRALRDPARIFTAGGCWCACWVLLACACFGVVLEGPMGAVVFWIVLGLANAQTTRPVAVDDDLALASGDNPADPMSLPDAEPHVVRSGTV